ncbi:hypothetical protein PLEOSDRAFT_169635 [Pleurotus ostreatus PC15]|uniref:Uncharacterized protein n=1 Tax=Pleurotus ostreatus (strain PC15) TaxID=1137138 RepID=A0A067NCE5_PLEO1|nr:hypothetical protein PLEOSDRAFT_169635 [Pleurotus ostreatus PC15]
MAKQQEQHPELNAPPGVSLGPKSLSKSPDGLLYRSSGITTVNINGPLNATYGGSEDTYNGNINGGFVGGRRNRNTCSCPSVVAHDGLGLAMACGQLLSLWTGQEHFLINIFILPILHLSPSGSRSGNQLLVFLPHSNDSDLWPHSGLEYHMHSTFTSYRQKANRRPLSP